MRTLINNIPPTPLNSTRKQFADGRIVPLGGAMFRLNGQSFKTPCSQYEYVSMTGVSIIDYEMESVRIYPSMDAREALASIVEEGQISGIGDRVYLISDNGCRPTHIRFMHLCKILNRKNGFFHQSSDEALRVCLTKRDGTEPREFVARYMPDVCLWNIGLGYSDLRDSSTVTSRFVLAS